MFNEPFSVLCNWAWKELCLGPEIWRQILVGLCEGVEGSFDEVLSSSGVTV
jgi:hypothetical protein